MKIFQIPPKMPKMEMQLQFSHFTYALQHKAHELIGIGQFCVYQININPAPWFNLSQTKNVCYVFIPVINCAIDSIRFISDKNHYAFIFNLGELRCEI